MSPSVIRAIDIGYGYTKFISSVNAKGQPKTESFPSVAAAEFNNQPNSNLFNKHDVISVLHQNVRYSVGEDALLLAPSNHQRNLNLNYSDSVEYDVLMRAALKKMHLKTIDRLMIGAPIANSNQLSEKLVKKWKGTIEVDTDQCVNILNVTVCPQPLGGFVQYCIENQHLLNLKKQRNLIIDPGHYTLDCLVSDNMKLGEGSHSLEGGISFLIEQIANQLGPSAKNLITLNRIDQLLYLKQDLKFKDDLFVLDDFKGVIERVVDQSVQGILSHIKNIDNIDNIILVGGGAEIYYPYLKKYLKNRQIFQTKAKNFANVLGFQIIGESLI